MYMHVMHYAIGVVILTVCCTNVQGTAARGELPRAQLPYSTLSANSVK